MNKLVCCSCKEEITNQRGTARFLCPKCGKMEIIRCPHCRKLAAKYQCPACQFEGPN